MAEFTHGQGLTTLEAKQRLAQYGSNSVSTRSVTWLSVLLRQFCSPILLLLIAAASIAGLLSEFSNAIEIGIIILISVGLSFSTEFRAEKANADLHARVAHSATVIRDGVNQVINVLDIVPGDVVILGVGSIVAADMTVLDAEELECDESLLTGESFSVSKAIGDELLMGTVIKSGIAKTLVTQTGSKTQFGLIAKELGHRPPESDFQIKSLKV
ncbi:MAG: cation-transporting P-type ATPase [Rhodoluna sp.]